MVFCGGWMNCLIAWHNSINISCCPKASFHRSPFPTLITMRLNIFSHSDSFLTLQPTFAADPSFAADPLSPAGCYATAPGQMARKEKERWKLFISLLLVAGGGLEPPTFGLWAQRATTAPSRDVLRLQRYCYYLSLQTFWPIFYVKKHYFIAMCMAIWWLFWN